MTAPPTLDRAIEIARVVRTELLSREMSTTRRDLAGQCGLVSMLVADALDDSWTIRVGFYMRTQKFCDRRGRYPYSHAWNQVGQTIVDATARQFDRRLRAVHVIRADEDSRYIETASGSDAIDVIMIDWLGQELPEYARLAKHLRRRHR